MAIATTTKMINPLLAVLECGQSVWYDNIRRGLIASGELQALIDDGLRGVTSNPSIFEKAIVGSTDYDAALESLLKEGEQSPTELYERLAIEDIRSAADLLAPVYEQTERRDGYVSLEVSPELSADTDGTVAEAVRLWGAVDRPNLMVKVPATPAGIPAVQTLISIGINVNVTLLFATATYQQVADAYIAGLEEHARQGGNLSHIASVASFFISRIDSAIDQQLLEIARCGPTTKRAVAQRLSGKVAVANAKFAYQRYKEIYGGRRWRELEAAGAQAQRLLWASTSTKNPRYHDTLYVEELIGADTVNTMPPATLDAFRDHGRARGRLEEDLEEAHDTLDTLGQLGIDLGETTDRLLDDAVRLFAEAFEKLLAAIAETGAGAKTTAGPTRLRWDPGVAVQSEIVATLEEWQRAGNVRRLWARDPSLWTGADEGEWLGWLGIVHDQLHHPEELLDVAAMVRSAGFDDAVLLGMGGSSLCPEMLSLSFGHDDRHPALHVLDSTDPAQVSAIERRVDLANTLFIVSSKSGSTLEPNIFKQYFFDRVAEAVDPQHAGARFIAITDPGSKLEGVAEADGFRLVSHGVRSIGGRYSALSNFGMVPAAVMGLDVMELLDRAERMAQACVSCVPARDNPGLVLGVIMGICARQGRDKLTLVTSPPISDFGAWLEQLIAESTGKRGTGIIPVDREPLAPPDVYGDDRLFVYLRLDGEADSAQDAAVDALQSHGHPLVRIDLTDRYEIGAEIFRWEFAVAVAGSVLGINPFNQPDVEASKVIARRLTTAYEESGALPAEEPIAVGHGLRLFADERNAAELTASVDRAGVEELLGAHLRRIRHGDYLALLGYVEMTSEHERALTELRRTVRERTGAASCVGFGPRFLHSTGQAYKGGPDSGVFLQITTDDPSDLTIPGQRYTFGIVKAAQARGDFEVLAERGRRALRVHVEDGEVGAGLATLQAIVERQLGK